MSSPLTLHNLETYDSPRSAELYGTERGLNPLEAQLVNEFFPPPPARVLDLGCGAGRTSVPLVEMGYDVVGIDMSASLLRIARSKDGALTLLRMDACALAFPSKVFDAALFSYNGIDCIFPVELRRKCLAEVFRVLRPGGAFVLSSHNYLGSVFSGGFFYVRGHWNAARMLWAQRDNPHFRTWYVWYPDEAQYLYSAPPDRTERQLESAGFANLAARGRGNEGRGRRLRWREQHVHFAATKPGGM